MTYPSRELRDGWQQRKRAEWNALLCADPVFAAKIKSGWFITTESTFSDGFRFTASATCPVDRLVGYGWSRGVLRDVREDYLPRDNPGFTVLIPI